MKTKSYLIPILTNNIIIVILTIICTYQYFKIVNDSLLHDKRVNALKTQIEIMKEVKEYVCKKD